MMAVSEFAMHRGITPRRVRALIESGKLAAQKVGNRWVLDEALLRPARPAVRPMSRRMAWALADELDGPGMHASRHLASTEVSRIRGKVERLKESDDPVALLSAWLADRADHRVFNADPGVVNELRADHRVIVSGISDERSGLSSFSEVEGYIGVDDLDDVVFDYLLVPGSRKNVVLHVVDRRPTKIGNALLAVDLADRSTPRELTRARALLQESL
ncbi:hypothetical protein [Leifsonia sp. EB34]|uniref:hypothetical protein n=1 Tax=Leifsonia sp. EB34 TaxID=3156303 RepID=UPI003517B064